MEKVGWGVLGCGVIGEWHCKAAQGVKHAELRAVCDAFGDRAKNTGERFGVPHYSELDEMLKRDDVHCVSICTPSGMHSEQGIACAQHGKHVLTEKPMDVTLERIDALIDACAKANVKLSCVFQKRTTKAVRSARSAVMDGRLGRMTLGDAYCKWYRPQSYYDGGAWRGTWKLDGGGCLMNQGVHTIDALLWIMGDVSSVFARADHLVRSIEVEDTAVAVVHYRNGAFGVIQGATSCNPGEVARLAFHGNSGTIIIEGERVAKWAISDKDGEQAVPEPIEETNGHREGASSDPRAISLTGHRRQVEDMAEAILDDRDPLVTPESARKPVQLILAIYESARTGKEVVLD